ncbi:MULTISPECIES: GNAT family N-acetyltransferase [unclassified Marinovum]
MFDVAPDLTDQNLRLRPLGQADFEPLLAAASDPLIWAQHPAKTRHQPAVFAPYFAFLLQAGGTLVAEDLDLGGKVIGCSRFYQVAERPGTMAIGFTFLSRAYWGGPMNARMKALMFGHVFTVFDEVWLDIGLDNIRSQRAAEKIGAVHVNDATFNLGNGASDYRCYRVRRVDWAA